jgi:hypothetical protein
MSSRRSQRIRRSHAARKRPLHDPAENAQASAVRLAAFGDYWSDAPLPEQPPVRVVVVAAVGEQRVWS